MKRLIDAYALYKWVCENAGYMGDNQMVVVDFITQAIKAQETVSCAYDFRQCPKEIRCEDILCGGACCEKP